MSINGLPIELTSQILSRVYSTENTCENKTLQALWWRKMIPVYQPDTTISYQNLEQTLRAKTMHDIYECTKVCKLWRRWMAPAYYKDTVIHRDHKQFLREVRTNLNENGDRIGDFIKTLTFGEEIDEPLTQKDFELLIDSLPSLRVVNFNPSSDVRIIEYMEYLDRMAMRTKLQEVSVVGPLPNNAVNYEKVCRLHSSINSQLNQQITALKLLEVSLDNQQEDEPEILDYLKGFTNLKHLTLPNADERSGARGDIDIGSVLDACCGRLHSLTLDTSWCWYISSNLKYHLNLTSLALALPGLYADLIIYLIEYVPNLKELDIQTDIDDRHVSDVYASLPPDVSLKFNCYLKQLDRLHCSSVSINSSNNRDIFWQTLRDIYDDKNYNHLYVRFYTQSSTDVFENEKIYFDRQPFNEKSSFGTCQFDSVLYPFDYLRIDSIYIHYIENGKGERRKIEFGSCLSNLLTFAASKQQAQAYISVGEERLILASKPVIDNTQFIFPQDQSDVQYAIFKNLMIDKRLLDAIGALYPTIKNMQLINCQIRMESEETSHVVLDLRQFKDLQELTIDVYQVLEDHTQTMFQWTNGEQIENYVYDQSVSGTVCMHSIISDESILKAYVIKIETTELQRLAFPRNSIDINIIHT